MSEISTTLLKTPPFLMWYDDSPKLTVTQKIEEAMHAYRTRFRGVRPTLVLVNEEEITEIAGVQVRGVNTVRRFNYWVGQDEAHAATAQEAAPPPPAAPRPAVSRPGRRRAAESAPVATTPQAASPRPRRAAEPTSAATTPQAAEPAPATPTSPRPRRAAEPAPAATAPQATEPAPAPATPTTPRTSRRKAS